MGTDQDRLNSFIIYVDETTAFVAPLLHRKAQGLDGCEVTHVTNLSFARLRYVVAQLAPHLERIVSFTREDERYGITQTIEDDDDLWAAFAIACRTGKSDIVISPGATDDQIESTSSQVHFEDESLRTVPENDQDDPFTLDGEDDREEEVNNNSTHEQDALEKMAEDRTVVEQYTAARGSAFCQFFGHESDRRWLNGDRQECRQVKLKSLKRPLHQHQAFAVFWMAERILGDGASGCILGEQMGLGKTAEVLVLWSRKFSDHASALCGYYSDKTPLTSCGVLTTYHSFKSQVETPLVNAGLSVEDQKRLWGIVVVDEFHEHNAAQLGPAKIVRGLEFNYQALILMSGTPYKNNKGSIKAWFRLLLHPVRDAKILEEISDACDEYDRILKAILDSGDSDKHNVDNSDQNPTDLVHAAGVLTKSCQPYIIRRLKSTKWFGYPCCDVPMPKPHDVALQESREAGHMVKIQMKKLFAQIQLQQQTEIKAWENLPLRQRNKTKRPSGVNSNLVRCTTRRMVQDGLFPSLSRLEAEGKIGYENETTLSSPRTIGHVRAQGWHRDPETSPHYKRIAEIVDHSVKIKELQRILDGLETYPDSNVPEKLAVVLFDPYSSWLVYLYMRTEGRAVQADVWRFRLQTALEEKIFLKMKQQAEAVTDEMTIDEMKDLFGYEPEEE
ncbi:hypothetical protein SLS55_005629 [Diplodia seriata]|uniref:Helicase ATP-binding domain-containing protein n=1 Tax=Diplodia seriata TaxID=420778 RepID=A0ABR3CGX7_9PEZI